MNKKLVVIGGVGIFLLLAIVASLGIKGQGANVAACNKFIGLVQAGNSSDSYQMFSAGAASLITQDGWQNEVGNLSAAYGNETKPDKVSDTSSVNPGSGANQSEVKYTLKGTHRTFSLACNTIQTGKTTQIDSFSSRLAD